jgi:hypothetical protein
VGGTQDDVRSSDGSVAGIVHDALDLAQQSGVRRLWDEKKEDGQRKCRSQKEG